MIKKRAKPLVGWVRTASVGAAGLMFCALVRAQSAEGTLSVQTQPQADVEIFHVETGLKQRLQAGDDGFVHLPKLPPGMYRVTVHQASRDVEVLVGRHMAVDLTDDQEVRVTAGRGLGMTHPTSGRIFRRSDLQKLPIDPSVDSVALLAPGVVRGDRSLGSGKLPSFGGASVGENGYYINGFDVTNIRSFLSYVTVPFEAIFQEEVKTGGLDAEYGRSLGGVVSVVTRSGSNVWHGGASLTLEPQLLRARARDVANRTAGSALDYTLYQSRDASNSTSAVAYLSGPVIENRLYFFGLLQGEHGRADDFEAATNVRSRTSQPSGLLKLDWWPHENHHVEWTGIHTQNHTSYTDYNNTSLYSPRWDGLGQISRADSGSTASIFKYTGQWTQDLTASLLYGRANYRVEEISGARMKLGCPTVVDSDEQPIGCWSKVGVGSTLRDSNAPADEDRRRAWRFDLNYKLGTHHLRGGLDYEKFSSDAAGQIYYGGAYYGYSISKDGSVNGIPNVVRPGSPYVWQYVRTNTSGTYMVRNQAWYVDDSWEAIPKYLTLYGGLRSESFDNQDAQGRSFVKADRLIAPRTGFVWNVGGEGTLRIFGTAGRYFIPVSSSTNIRLTRGETEWYSYHTYSSRDPVSQVPLGLSSPIGGTVVVRDGRLPDPATVASTSLKPMAQDEFVLGFQRLVTSQWRFGLKGTYRTVRHGMDDFCAHYPMANWAADNGYMKFDPATLASCILINPGQDVTLKMDVDNNGRLKQVTIPASYFGLTSYRRKYQGIEFTLDREFDDVWEMSFSYTWSRSIGTAEGYVQSSLNQGDAGTTQDFDTASLTRGAYGYLPNDRRHQFKLSGRYALNANFSIGLVGTLASGRPISCMGYVPQSASDYGEAQFAQPSSFYCLNEKGVPELHRRGSMGRTPWASQFDLKLMYTQKMSQGAFLSLQADIFNVFNQQSAIEVDEFGDATEFHRNANYGTPTAFSTPRYVRLTARYDF